MTVGSFDSLAIPRSDGTTENHPAVQHVIQEYGAQPQQVPGGRMQTFLPKTLGNVTFDIQPVPIPVPKLDR